MKINDRYCTNFKAGYSSDIRILEKNIKPKSVERYFKTSRLKDFGTFYNIDLKNNKAIALGNKLCAEIFKNVRKVYDFRKTGTMQDLIYPQDIYVFNEKASPFYNQHYFFVNNTNIRPEKEKPTFYPGTVFVNNEVDSLENLNCQVESLHNKNAVSTNHFLYNFVHEWLHSTFINGVKDKAFRGAYSFDKTMQNYESQKLSQKEKQLVSEIISSYPSSCESGQYSEVFAESWTKFICESLDKDCTSFSKNPLDILNSTPTEFQELLKKISDIKMLKFI